MATCAGWGYRLNRVSESAVTAATVPLKPTPFASSSPLPSILIGPARVAVGSISTNRPELRSRWGEPSSTVSLFGFSFLISLLHFFALLFFERARFLGNVNKLGRVKLPSLY
jgi:hypothetical protein